LGEELTIVAFEGVEGEVLKHLVTCLREAFSMPVRVVSARGDSLRDCMNVSRGQLRAACVLKLVAGLRDVTAGGIALGVVPHDAYVEGLNFVLGLASQYQAAAVIFLERLKDRYGLPRGAGGYVSTEVYLSRVLKEALHELGHVYGLEHCPNPRCVMRFSNSVADTDFKECRYCQSCAARLRAAGVKLSEKYVMGGEA